MLHSARRKSDAYFTVGSKAKKSNSEGQECARLRNSSSSLCCYKGGASEAFAE